MQIQNISSNYSFKGKYYFTSDTHSKPVAVSSLLNKIETDAKNEKQAVYLDNGDIYTDFGTLMTNIFTSFAQKNSNIQSVFNLGNAEYIYMENDTKNCSKNLRQLTDSGINVICTPMKHICDKLGLDKKDFECVKPYAIVKDNIKGKEVDILVVGSMDIRNSDVLPIDKQVDILAETIKSAQEKHNPYKTILMSHNLIEDTKTILDKLEQKGIYDIELVCGGHSHKIEDETYKGARILHPAAQAKSAYKITLDESGFHMNSVLYDKVNRYDYSMQETQNNADIISNISIDVDKIADNYTNFLKETDLLNEITTSKVEIKNRELDTVSNPSEMGSIFASKLKEETGADMAITLSQDIRGDLPKIGEKIYAYNISDIMGVNKKAWMLNVNKEQLFDIFNISLKQQHDNVANSDFLEFSNNVIIERYAELPDEKIKSPKEKLKYDRVKEIYIKNGDSLKRVSAMSNDEKISVACCSFIANGLRASISYFKTIDDKNEIEPAVMTRDVFTQAVKEIQLTGEKPKKSRLLSAPLM